MRDLQDARYVCYSKLDYKELMTYILKLKAVEKSCKDERLKP